jgi:hypothetical protein
MPDTIIAPLLLPSAALDKGPTYVAVPLLCLLACQVQQQPRQHPQLQQQTAPMVRGRRGAVAAGWTLGFGRASAVATSLVVATPAASPGRVCHAVSAQYTIMCSVHTYVRAHSSIWGFGKQVVQGGLVSIAAGLPRHSLVSPAHVMGSGTPGASVRAAWLNPGPYTLPCLTPPLTPPVPSPWTLHPAPCRAHPHTCAPSVPSYAACPVSYYHSHPGFLASGPTACRYTSSTWGCFYAASGSQHGGS